MTDLREEFLAEANEIVESLSRDLLLLDQALKDDSQTLELVNEVFRSIHTLKGIAGMFGYGRVGDVAHRLEDLLDGLRLGRQELSAELLDVMFEGIEVLQSLLIAEPEVTLDLAPFLSRLGAFGPKAPSLPPSDLASFDFDESVLSVLTEYEEHRLRTNISKGVGIFRLSVRFNLMTIDSDLELLKSRAKPVGEIITYLPSADAGGGDFIELDVLLASSSLLTELEEAFQDFRGTVKAIGRREARVPAVAAPHQPALRHDDLVLSADDGGAPGALATGDGKNRSLAHTVRVDIRKLDHLMTVVGELAIVRNAMVRLSESLRAEPELRSYAIDIHRINRGFERNLEELQDGILDVRMVPLGQTFDRLARIVRQVAREHSKEVQLIVTGADTEVDKLIMEELSDPLMHIIRNAIDHGIESPRIRELAGKPITGTLVLNAYQKGNHVVIEVEDDGAGMNPQAITESAIRKGLIDLETARELTTQEIFSLVFTPGFSTREAITDLSGRGVGMDVVKTNIARLGGLVEIQSEYGAGTKITVTLPVTLAIISVLLIRVLDREYAVPITNVQEAILLEQNRVRVVDGKEMLSLRGQSLPLCRLDRLFGLPSGPTEARRYVIVIASGNRRVGFVVHSLEGQQDIVIKALGPSLRGIRGLAGATDLGNQRVALVLDAATLVEEHLSTDRMSVEARGAS